MIMKHFFIINVVSGVGNGHLDLVKKIENFILMNKIDGAIHRTQGILDAYHYAKNICSLYSDEDKRFYACGGDGTINEIANALVGVENADIAIVPCGTGNDFVINFEGYDKDTTIEELARAKSDYVDVMQVNDSYCVNICNIGLDAVVAYNMTRMKKIPFVKGKLAYYISLVYSFLTPLGISIDVVIDGIKMSKCNLLLMLVANGKRYGGSFLASPNSDVTDGQLFFCAVKQVPRLLMAKLISLYKKGLHIKGTEESKKHFIMQACKQVLIHSQKPVPVCCDGEIALQNCIDIKVVSKAIRVVQPMKYSQADDIKNPTKETTLNAVG